VAANRRSQVASLRPPRPTGSWSEEERDGRPGLRTGADRRVRPAGSDDAGVAAPVIVENLIGGLLAAALIVYLLIALVRPEKF
jgi:K+-transporting ATPase KdpF subunit